MGEYQDYAASATESIKAKGQPMTLRRTVQGPFDPVTSTHQTPTISDYPCYGLFKAINSTSANALYGTGTLANSLIQKDDKMILLDAATLGDVMPLADDEIIPSVGETHYTVVFVNTLQPAGVPVLHNIHVRK